MKHGETISSPKSSDAGVPSGAGASRVSWSTSTASPSSHSRIASAATTSTRSQVMLPASLMARSLDTPSLAESSLMILMSGFSAMYGSWYAFCWLAV